MSKNIIFVAPLPPIPVTSGYSYYLMNRIEYLKNNNYKIFFFTQASNLDNNKSLIALKQYCEEIQAYPKSNKRLNRILLNLRRLWLPRTVSSLFSSKMKSDIALCLNSRKIDAVFVEYPYLLINIPFLKDSTPPIILAQHNLEFSKMKKRAKHNQSLLKSLLILFESYMLKNYERKNVKKKMVSLYTFISDENKNDFEQIFKTDNTYLLPVGYNVHGRNQLIYHKGKIVFVGAMDVMSNILAMEWFVDKIFPALTEKIPNIKLYIVGRNPPEKITSLKSENTVVTGTVAKVDDYLLDAHLYIVPLTFGDGVKIKTIEAFATGNIVVSTNIGIEGVSAFVQNTDYLLANTEEEFIQSCFDVLSCRENYEHLAKSASGKVQKLYSWKSILQSYESKISDLMEKSV